MKRVYPILIVIFCFAAALCIPKAPAEAASAPHVVVHGEVWLLDADGTRLFLLPDTYYAKISNLDDSFYYVVFNGISGKVDKNSASTTGYHAVATGTMREIRISKDYADVSAMFLKKAPAMTADAVSSVPYDTSFTFLGHYPVDKEIWYYVSYNGHYGYIRSDRTDFPLELGTFTPEAEAVAPPVEEPPAESADSVLKNKTLRILIIIGVCVPALLVVFLIFRSGKIRKEKY